MCRITELPRTAVFTLLAPFFWAAFVAGARVCFVDKHQRPVIYYAGLTWRAWYYRCRPSPTPSPCQDPWQNGEPAACAPSRSEG